ncbi:MAG: diguanylate cyclase [Tissierellia bacterium]|nr:diguanylate cyclase [Tissierellia bacterium]
MKLIDNRYKIGKILEEDLYSSTYEAIDFWNNDRRLFMKLYNVDKQNKVIDYFTHNFIYLSKIKHKHLLTSGEFSIIKTIDRKKVGIKQYYSTMEYINNPSLDKIYMTLSFREKLNIILQVCTVLDFLHYKGIVYRHLSPSNIFLLEDGIIKIMDLVNIYENIIHTDYDNLTRYFIAPEVLLEHEDIVNKNADKYSLGMLMIYLLTEDFYRSNNKEFNYISESQLNDKQIKFLNKTIINLTKRKSVTREGILRDIIDNINNIFNMDYKYSLEKERGTLNFKTKIIGREKGIEKILRFDDYFVDNKFYRKAICINGDIGVGKTRFLKEIVHLLRMRGRDVYYSEITEDDNIDFKPVTNILRQTIKDTPRDILGKYGIEFARVLPELKFLSGNESFNGTTGNRERLRLYDRITRYLEEFSKDRPIYLVIDNIEKCNIQILSLFDYIMNNIKKGNILFITSFNEKMLIEGSINKKILNKLIVQECVEEIKLPNFDLSEIGEFIQHILGISYKPLKFSAVMLKESQGNPRHIEYMMKNLFATGELFFNSEGFWEIKTQKYSDIYFPSSIDESLKNQISLIEDNYMDIMEIVSIYKSSVSKKTLLKMLDIGTEDLNNKLDELIRMGLLDEKVADWGYSYSIGNIQLKKLIYHKVPKDERIKLHKKVALLLEEIYRDDYKVIMDELIHHLMSSNQLNKALGYMTREARKGTNIYGSQSILLWKEAYEISKNIKSKYKFEILENLGKGYAIKGENDKALKIYTELLEESIGLGETKYTIVANIGIGEIYLNRNLIDLALGKANRSIELSKKTRYLDGLVQAHILYNKILLDNGKLEDVEKNMEYLLEFSIKDSLNKYLGDIYNILGLVKYYKGDIKEAINNFRKSIPRFHEMDKFIDSTKPINNIGNIYMHYYGDKKRAMEYYKEGLDILEKYSAPHTELIFLNNIGEVYISLCEYDKAKEYIEKARIVSTDVEDTNMIFLTNINLGLIYLLIGNYAESYNYYIMLKESYAKNQVYSLEVTNQYYNYLGEFYCTFGKWDESIKYSQKTMDMCKEFSYKEYLRAKSRMVFAAYFKNSIYDKNSIEDIRTEFKNINLSFDRRRFLLYMAIISFSERDYKYVVDILQEDKELKKDCSFLVLDYIREILLYSISDEEYSHKNIIRLEEDMKKHNLLFIDIFFNTLLGSKFFEDGKYYQAINYLLEGLDTIYRLIKDIPDKELQISYIKSRRGDDIKDKLAEVIYKVFQKEISYIHIEDLNFEDNIEKYFEYESLLSLMSDEEFARITETNYVYDEIKEIDSIETLISKLTSDYEHNLKLILRYLAKETFAQTGYILIYDEESNKYIPIISLNDDMNWSPNENLLALANRHKRGILINDNLGDNVIGLYKGFLPKGTRALLCVPITVSKSNGLYKKEERRKSSTFNEQINEGYIYLETFRVFNRFDETRHKLAYVLSQILYINIENYKLKILSTIDKLTGTYTRKYFENEFNKILNEAKRNEKSFALLMIDIDRFKNINDTYGHRKGDEVLNRIGHCLVDSVRSTDLVAKYGGDEFVIILRNIIESEARKIGEKIRSNIKRIKVSKIEDTITISVGISMFPKHSQFKEELIEKADQALYRAKEKGRNMVVVWDTHLANTLNRVDKLAGILSGNTNQDQRNILAILDVIELVRENIGREEKIFKFLGRLIEILEAENCTLIELDNNKDIKNTRSRSRLNPKWVENVFVNYTIVKRVIASGKGEFLIDWESVEEAELTLNTPNWQSVIAMPLICNDRMKGLIYITTPIKEKEFDYNGYNLSKVLCEIFSIIM